MSTRRIVG